MRSINEVYREYAAGPLPENPTAPSAGAMRAAQEIVHTQAPHPTTDDVREAARIIDAETGLAQAAEALRVALSWLSSYPGGGAVAAYDRARAALAKIEGAEEAQR